LIAACAEAHHSVLEAEARFDHTIETFRAYTRAHPDFHLTPDAIDPWVGSLMNLARFRDAVELARLGVHGPPKSVDAWSELGIAYDAANQSKDALDSYTHVISLDQHNVFAADRIKVLKSTPGL
jgi:tetratricopeptide (TPR) repeat protein